MKRTEWDKIFLSIQKTLRLSLAKTMSSPDDIDDVVQETYLRAVASNTSSEVRNPKAYLFRTSRNIALNEKAKIYRRLESALPVEELDKLSVLMDDNLLEQDALMKEMFAEFCVSLSELPLQCRKVFILRKVYDLSQKEIARRLGISVSTVETHITRGMAKIHNPLADQKPNVVPAKNVGKNDEQ